MPPPYGGSPAGSPTKTHQPADAFVQSPFMQLISAGSKRKGLAEQPARSLNWLLKFICEFQDARYTALVKEIRLGSPLARTPHFVYEVLNTKYGLKRLTDKMAWQVFTSLQKYQRASPVVHLFLLFLNEVYDTDDFAFFVTARHRLLTSVIRDYQPGDYVDIASVKVPEEHWFGFARNAFPSAEHADVADFVARVSATATSPPRGVQYVLAHDLLETAIAQYRVWSEKAVEDSVSQSFTGAALSRLVSSPAAALPVSTPHAAQPRASSLPPASSPIPRTPQASRLTPSARGVATPQYASASKNSTAATQSLLQDTHLQLASQHLSPEAHRVEVQLVDNINRKDERIYALEERLLQQAQAKMKAEDDLKRTQEELQDLQARYARDIQSIKDPNASRGGHGSVTLSGGHIPASPAPHPTQESASPQAAAPAPIVSYKRSEDDEQLIANLNAQLASLRENLEQERTAHQDQLASRDERISVLEDKVALLEKDADEKHDEANASIDDLAQSHDLEVRALKTSAKAKQAEAQAQVDEANSRVSAVESELEQARQQNEEQLGVISELQEIIEQHYVEVQDLDFKLQQANMALEEKEAEEHDATVAAQELMQEAELKLEEARVRQEASEKMAEDVVRRSIAVELHEETVRQAGRDLVAREQSVNDSVGGLAESEMYLSDMQFRLDERHREADTIEAKLKLKEKELELEREKLQVKAQEVDVDRKAKEQELSSKQQHHDLTTRALTEREAAVDAKVADLEQREASLKEETAALNLRKTAVEQRLNTLHDREVAITDRESQLAERETQIAAAGVAAASQPGSRAGSRAGSRRSSVSGQTAAPGGPPPLAPPIPEEDPAASSGQGNAPIAVAVAESVDYGSGESAAAPPPPPPPAGDAGATGGASATETQALQDVARLEEEKTVLKDALTSMRFDLDKARGDLETANASRQQALDDLSTTRQQLFESEERAEALRARVQDAQDETAVHDDEARHADAAVFEAKKKTEAAEDALKAAQADLHAKEAELATAETKLGELQRDLNIAEAAKQSAEDRAAKLEGDGADVQETAAQLKTTRNLLAKTAEDLSDAQSSAEIARGQMEDMKQELADSQAETAEVQTKLREAEAASAKAALAAMERDQLQEKLSKAHAAAAQLSGENAAYESQVDNLSADLSDLRTRLSQKEEELARVQTELAEAKEQAAAVPPPAAPVPPPSSGADEGSGEDANITIENLKTELAESENRVKKLTREVASLRVELAHAKRGGGGGPPPPPGAVAVTASPGGQESATPPHASRAADPEPPISPATDRPPPPRNLKSPTPGSGARAGGPPGPPPPPAGYEDAVHANQAASGSTGGPPAPPAGYEDAVRNNQEASAPPPAPPAQNDAEVERLTQDLTKSKELLKRLMDKMKAEKAKTAALKKEVAAKDAALREAQDDAANSSGLTTVEKDDEIKAMVDQHEKTVADLQRKVRMLETRRGSVGGGAAPVIPATSAESDGLTDSELEKANEELSQQVTRLTDELRSTRQNHNAKVAALRAGVESSMNESADLKLQVEILTKERDEAITKAQSKAPAPVGDATIEELQRTIRHQQEKIQALSSVETVDRDTESLRLQVEELQGQLAEQERASAAEQERLQAALDRSKDLLSRLTAKMKKMSANSQGGAPAPAASDGGSDQPTAIALEAELSERAAQVADLQSQLEAARNEQQKLDQQLKKEREDSREATREANEALDALQASVEEKEQKINLLKAEGRKLYLALEEKKKAAPAPAAPAAPPSNSDIGIAPEDDPMNEPDPDDDPYAIMDSSSARTVEKLQNMNNQLKSKLTIQAQQLDMMRKEKDDDWRPGGAKFQSAVNKAVASRLLDKSRIRNLGSIIITRVRYDDDNVENLVYFTIERVMSRSGSPAYRSQPIARNENLHWPEIDFRKTDPDFLNEQSFVIKVWNKIGRTGKKDRVLFERTVDISALTHWGQDLKKGTESNMVMFFIGGDVYALASDTRGRRGRRKSFVASGSGGLPGMPTAASVAPRRASVSGAGPSLPPPPSAGSTQPKRSVTFAASQETFVFDRDGSAS